MSFTSTPLVRLARAGSSNEQNLSRGRVMPSGAIRMARTNSGQQGNGADEE